MKPSCIRPVASSLPAGCLAGTLHFLPFPLAAMGMLMALFAVAGSFVGSVQSKISIAGLQKLRRHPY